MLTFERGQNRFNYRVAGVFLDQAKILLHITQEAPFWLLPGGRCEMGEASDEAITREMQEELEIQVKIERLLWIVENFFEYSHYHFHELAFYYLLSMPTDCELLYKSTFTAQDSGVTLYFQWFSLNELDALELYPAFLKTDLLHLPLNPHHIIHRDPRVSRQVS